MTMEIRITKTDKQKEQAGVEVVYDGVKFRIKRWKTEYLLQVHRQLQKRNRNRRIKMDDPEYQRLMIEKFADKVVIGWDPFEVQGQTIEYSRENCINLLTNDPDCLDFISDSCRDIELFMVEEKEDIMGE